MASTSSRNLTLAAGPILSLALLNVFIANTREHLSTSAAPSRDAPFPWWLPNWNGALFSTCFLAVLILPILAGAIKDWKTFGSPTAGVVCSFWATAVVMFGRPQVGASTGFFWFSSTLQETSFRVVCAACIYLAGVLLGTIVEISYTRRSVLLFAVPVPFMIHWLTKSCWEWTRI